MSTDLAWRLLRQGYAALPLSRLPGTDAEAWPVRMLGRRALVVRGAAGARLFYDTTLVRRRGAVPLPLAALLFGRGAVHGLDGDEHATRKRVFLDVLTEESVDRLARQAHGLLQNRVEAWSVGGRVSVLNELVEAYGLAVQRWAGLMVHTDQAASRSRDLAVIVDGFGGVGSAYLRGWRARRRCQRWAAEAVRAARSGGGAPPGSALDVIAHSGLDDRTAATELLNLLRPTVAVAWFGAFAALALDQHAELRDRVRDDAEAREAFAHEVRRVYPFVPALAARTRQTLEWQGHRLPAGRRLILDVRGTDLDPGVYDDAVSFRPDRFAKGLPGPYELLPQGGGHPETGHRCPGERATLRLLDVTLQVLASASYAVVGERGYRLDRIPTAPADGLLVTAVEPVGTRDHARSSLADR